MHFIIKTQISYIEARYASHYVSGIGEKAVFQSEPLGWFIGFDGSYELLHVGMEHPDMKIGDKVRITIEKEV